MAQSLIQRSFAGGEIAPAMYGRADQTKYQTGLKACRNFTVLKHGGVANRAGSGFINEVLDSSVRTYMIRFVFNAEQTYVIEVGEEYFRFYRNGARIVVSGVAAWVTLTVYAVGDLVSNGGFNYYCVTAHTAGATFAGDIANWYQLDGTIYEIPHPYAPADLAMLKFVQSADVVTITHRGYAPRELTRTGHTAWTLVAQTFAPSQAAPTNLVVTAAGGAATNWRYKVTAVMTESYEESLPTAAATDTGDAPTVLAPHTLTWTAAAGTPVEYNVYRETADGSGFYGFIGVAGTNSFTDDGFVVDPSISPPVARNPFAGAGDFPGTVSYYQQRLMLAGTTNNPEKNYGSRTAMFDNFTISSPLQDDDAVTFTIAGREVNEVRHLVEIGELVILTAGGEWVVLGDSDGTLRANQPPNLKQVGYNGASDVMPVVVSNSLVFLQARGNVMRDLRNEVSADGKSSAYTGRDLTVFAGHLFGRTKTIERMAYSQIPNSVVWCVRSDGVLLGLTYLREHEVWGWHRHDTDGFYEDVCVVPEGNEDAVYVIVRREINGVTKRYIERFVSREFTDIEVDAIFLDSFLTYDGRNTTATTLTLSTGAGWTVDDTITITASSAQFIAGDVGNDYILYVTDADDVEHEVAIRVTGFTSNVIVEGTPSKTVPTALRGVATATWTRAVDQLAGLGHLALKDVGVFADGNVIASPNNEDYDVITVTAGGEITLDRPYGVIHVGLGYVSDFQTLDLDIAGEQVRDRLKNVTHISLLVESSRGIFAGPDEDNLTELQPEPVEDYGDPWPLQTGIVELAIASTWNESGSFLVRQKDPLPLTILSAIPSGQMGG